MDIDLSAGLIFCSERISEVVSAHRLEVMEIDLGRIAAALEKNSPSFYDGPFFTAIVGAIVAAIAAWVFTFLHWKHTSRKENQCSAIIALSSVIERLQSVSVSYWLKDFDEKDDEIVAQEIEIKSLLLIQIASFDCLMRMKGENKNVDGSYKRPGIQELSEAIRSTYELITGDEFESIRKKKDIAKANKISVACIYNLHFLATLRYL